MTSKQFYQVTVSFPSGANMAFIADAVDERDAILQVLNQRTKLNKFVAIKVAVITGTLIGELAREQS